MNASEPRPAYKKCIPARWSERKQRLLACGLCRHVLEYVPAPELSEALDVAEAYADGTADRGELERAGALAVACSKRISSELFQEQLFASAICTAATIEDVPAMPPQYPEPRTFYYRTSLQVANIVLGALSLIAPHRRPPQERELFPATYEDLEPRAIGFDLAWRTSTAVAIAQLMYESRDFSAMPILADALQDAGCDSDEILNHCRSANATHVRGCWVVDLVLGRREELGPA